MINLNNIHQSFSGRYKPLFNALSLSINAGDFCTIIGNNGCGKSTLFQIINGQLKPESGTVTTSGKIASVTQNIQTSTIGDLSVLENLILCTHSTLRPLPYHRLKSQMSDLLEEINLGLEAFLDQPMRHLSGGQRQVIATLCSIHSGHPIILLDEHTSALDPRTQAILMNYTQSKITALNLTALMITHNHQDALSYGNRLLVLNHGLITLDVSHEEKYQLKPSDLIQHLHKPTGDDHDL